MPITTKTVKGTKYLYFVYYDPIDKTKREKYCGPASDPKAREKAQELEKEHLQEQIVSLQNQLSAFDTSENVRKRRRTSTFARSCQEGIDALSLLKDTRIHAPDIYYTSSESMKEVENDSVQLIVTSPPYNVGKAYASYDDNREVSEYLDFLNRVWVECKRVLCKGGRIAVNVADTWRQPYYPLHCKIIEQLDRLRLLMRGVIYWDKGASVGVSTAWGSWRSGSNPTLRDVGEHIVIFSKDSFKLESENKIATISSEEFTAYTKSLWSFPTADKREGHPAPFPEELPKRLIQLYTFVGDTVLDPFLGSGTTCKVAKAWGRRSIGYEIDESYRPVIEAKIAQADTLAIPLDAFTTNGKRFLDDYERPIPRSSATKSSR